MPSNVRKRLASRNVNARGGRYRLVCGAMTAYSGSVSEFAYFSISERKGNCYEKDNDTKHQDSERSAE